MSEPLRPTRRSYTSIEGRGRNQDAFERVTRIRVLAWSLLGAFMGFLLGVFATSSGTGGGALTVVGTTAAGWAMAYFGPLALAHWSGRAAASIYAPSGGSTPRRREYSLAESYVARGEYAAAVRAFEEAIAEDGAEPAPYLRVARVHRDRMGDDEGAATWFRRALREPLMDRGLRLLVLRELVELYEIRMGEPARAAPVLARMAEEYAGAPEATRAAETLARIKADMPRE